MLLTGCAGTRTTPNTTSVAPESSLPATRSASANWPDLRLTKRKVASHAILRSPKLDHGGSGWEADGVETIRYDTDGRRIFFSLGWTNQLDDGSVDDGFYDIATIKARPKPVKLENLPRLLRSTFGYWDEELPVYGISPGGKYAADEPDNPDAFERLVVVITDQSSGSTRTLEIPDSAQYNMVNASWFGDHTLAVAMGDNDPGQKGRLILLDVLTGDTKTVADISPRRGNLALIERVVADPSGFVVFDLDSNSDYTYAVHLYRCDLATGRIIDLHVSAPPQGWDYSPVTGRYAVPVGSTQVEERPLPTL
jgi:hypothetical protein